METDAGPGCVQPDVALLAEFRSWLGRERGLSPVSVCCYSKQSKAFLAGIGGSVNDNVERWKKAVTDPAGGEADMKVRTQTVQGIKVTLVTGDGTYSAMTGGGVTVPKPGSGFRGAIIEGPQGLVFVRLAGPAADVTAATPAWLQLVLGVRKQ